MGFIPHTVIETKHACTNASHILTSSAVQNLQRHIIIHCMHAYSHEQVSCLHHPLKGSLPTKIYTFKINTIRIHYHACDMAKLSTHICLQLVMPLPPFPALSKTLDMPTVANAKLAGTIAYIVQVQALTIDHTMHVHRSLPSIFIS